MIAVIEMSAGTDRKFEVNKETGRLRLDRTLTKFVPYNYGYIENTLAPDGDPLDVFVVSFEPIPSLVEVEVVLIGGFICTDNGVTDEKLIAYLKTDQNLYALKADTNEVAEAVQVYLQTYKKGFQVLGYFEADVANSLAQKYSTLEQTQPY